MMISRQRLAIASVLGFILTTQLYFISTSATPRRSPAAVSLADFNEACYLARYPDVAKNWVSPGLTAADHYIRHGFAEKRVPGCVQIPAAFNETCYLIRYPDIVTHWVNHGLKASDHYIQYGQYENRTPGCDPVAKIETQTIIGDGAKPIQVTINVNRFAGAVSSLKWNFLEFVNIYDHGRQIQTAIQVGDYSECHNPTEAGTELDARKNTSTSVVQAVDRTAYNSISTKNQMAYWVYNKTAFCPIGKDPRVTSPLSNHFHEKKITIGAFNDPHIIDYKIKITHGSNSINQGEKVVYEFLTGYLNGSLDKFYYVNSAKELVYFPYNEFLETAQDPNIHPYARMGRPRLKEHFDPVIVAYGPSHAMGIYTPRSTLENCGSRFHGYNLTQFLKGPFLTKSGPDFNRTNKWSLALDEVYPDKCTVGNTRSFQVYLAVGTLKDVHAKLVRLMQLAP